MIDNEMPGNKSESLKEEKMLKTIEMKVLKIDTSRIRNQQMR